jgi:hypothetical protein
MNSISSNRWLTVLLMSGSLLFAAHGKEVDLLNVSYDVTR